MRVIEIIFFALLAFYIFSRLLNVLGKRTGHERPYDPFDEDDTDKNNVIVLPNRQHAEEGEDELVQGPFAAQIAKIREEDPDFDLEDFEEKASVAYRMIVEAYHAGDIDFLKEMLDEKVFAQFEKAILAREKRGEKIQNEFVGDITSMADFIEVHGSRISIEMKIVSQQRLITLDKGGKIIDNTDESILKIIEYWTFSKQLGSDDPTWFLSKTQTSSIH